jgi:hypothetical protein
MTLVAAIGGNGRIYWAANVEMDRAIHHIITEPMRYDSE